MEFINSSAEINGPKILNINQSLWDMFASAAARHPHKEAVVSCWQKSFFEDPSPTTEVTPDCARMTFGDLFETAEALAVDLGGRGCSKGKRLLAVLDNSIEFVLLLWTAARLRMAFVPLNPMSWNRDWDYYIRIVKPHVLVVHDEKDTEMSASCRIPIQMHCSTANIDEWLSLPAILASLHLSIYPSFGIDIEDYGGDVALIVFTACGTSGPKGCLHTAKNIWSQSFDSDFNDNWMHTDTWLIQTPLWHMFGMNDLIRSLRYGGRVVLAARSFDAVASLQALIREECTRTSVFPPMVQALLEVIPYSLELPKLNRVTILGPTITTQDVKMCGKICDGMVLSAYGLSEGAPITAWRPRESLNRNQYYTGVGKVVLGCSVKICPADSTKALSWGEKGELHVSGSSIIDGYLDDDVEEDCFYHENGRTWVRTREQGFIDVDDILYITDRVGEYICHADIEEFIQVSAGIKVCF